MESPDTPGFLSLQFMDNGTNIGSWVPVVAGDASITTTLQPGTHTLTVGFAGHCPTDPHPWIHIGCLGGTTSTSNAVTYVVNPPPPTPGPTPPAGIQSTTTTLQVAPNPGYSFIPEILIARVSPSNAVGTVQFWDGNTNVRNNLGDAVPVTGGIALKFATLSKGNHTLTAVFNPANIGGCLGVAGFPGMPTPQPCPNSNVPAFLSSVSSPVSLTVQSLSGLSFWPLPSPLRAAGR